MAEVGSSAPYRLKYLPMGLVLVSVARIVSTSRVNRRRAATGHFAVYRTERNQAALTIAFESAGHEPDAEPDTQINGLRVWCADGLRRRSVIAAGDNSPSPSGGRLGWGWFMSSDDPEVLELPGVGRIQIFGERMIPSL